MSLQSIPQPIISFVHLYLCFGALSEKMSSLSEAVAAPLVPAEIEVLTVAPSGSQ